MSRPNFSAPWWGNDTTESCFSDCSTCFWSTTACCFCAPCTVSRAFELLHPQFQESVTYSDSAWCALLPRTCLGCAMCSVVNGPWSLAYVVNHAKETVTCGDTCFLLCCGQLLCYPAAISMQLRNLHRTKGAQRLDVQLLMNE